MGKKFILFFLINFLNIVEAQKIDINRTYGRSILYDIEAINDSEYVIAGCKNWNIMPDVGSIWILKINHIGNLQWEKTYKIGDYSNAKKIKNIGNNEFIVAAEIMNNDPKFKNDFALLKMQSNGDTLWSKIFPNDSSEWIHSFEFSEYDSGIIMVGSSDINKKLKETDIEICKTDKAGNLLWTKYYGGEGNDIGHDLISYKNDQIIIIGRKDDLEKDTRSLWILCINNSGDTIWTKEERCLVDIAEAEKIIKTKDGGYVIVGNLIKNGNNDIWITKFDEAFNVVWCKLYDFGDSDLGHAIANVDDGFIVTGSIYNDTSEYDLIIMKINKNGDKQWHRIVNWHGNIPSENIPVDGSYQVGYDIITKNNEYITVGYYMPGSDPYSLLIHGIDSVSLITKKIRIKPIISAQENYCSTNYFNLLGMKINYTNSSNLLTNNKITKLMIKR
jgi:hypothetical protein